MNIFSPAASCTVIKPINPVTISFLLSLKNWTNIHKCFCVEMSVDSSKMMAYFLFQKSSMRSVFSAGKMMFLIKHAHLFLCNFMCSSVLPCPYATMISLRWSTVHIAQWQVMLTAICSSTTLTLSRSCLGVFLTLLLLLLLLIIIYSSIFITQVTLDMSIIIYNLYITSLIIYGLLPTTV